MGSQTWNLPAPVDDPDSMLSRKFGRETVNYFAGSVLNRVGWLRTDHTFIRSAFQSKDTKFMLLKDLSPLTSAPTRVQFVSYDDVKPLTTEDPFGPSEEDLIKNFDSTVTKPLIIFLGLEESAKVPFEYKGLKGRPWFAVDVTPKGSYADAANQLIEAQSSKGYKFLEGMRPMTLEPDHGKDLPLANEQAVCISVKLMSNCQLASTPRPVPSQTGTRATSSAPGAGSRLCRATRATSACVPPPTSQAPTHPASGPSAPRARASPTSASLVRTRP